MRWWDNPGLSRGGPKSNDKDPYRKEQLDIQGIMYCENGHRH